MPPTDLDDRLRRALALPHEQVGTEEAMGSVLSAMPRYRARRRALVGATGASVLGVLGLTLGLLIVGLEGPSTTTTTAEPAPHARANAAAPASACVEVQVATQPASCVGRIASTLAAGAPLSAGAQSSPSGQNGNDHGPGTPTFAHAATAAPTATVRAVAGQRVLVSLPVEPGVTWDRVTLTNLVGPPSTGERRLPTHVELATGRTEAIVPHAGEGGYEVVATGSASCASGHSCVPTTYQWSVTLNVRKGAKAESEKT
jgi:hypothetical protein